MSTVTPLQGHNPNQITPNGSSSLDQPSPISTVEQLPDLTLSFKPHDPSVGSSNDLTITSGSALSRSSSSNDLSLSLAQPPTGRRERTASLSTPEPHDPDLALPPGLTPGPIGEPKPATKPTTGPLAAYAAIGENVTKGWSKASGAGKITAGLMVGLKCLKVVSKGALVTLGLAMYGTAIALSYTVPVGGAIIGGAAGAIGGGPLGFIGGAVAGSMVAGAVGPPAVWVLASLGNGLVKLTAGKEYEGIVEKHSKQAPDKLAKRIFSQAFFYLKPLGITFEKITNGAKTTPSETTSDMPPRDIDIPGEFQHHDATITLNDFQARINEELAKPDISEHARNCLQKVKETFITKTTLATSPSDQDTDPSPAVETTIPNENFVNVLNHFDTVDEFFNRLLISANRSENDPERITPQELDFNNLPDHGTMPSDLTLLHKLKPESRHNPLDDLDD